MAGEIGNTVQDSRKTLYEFLQENDFYIDSTIADLLEKITTKITTNTRKAIMLRGPAGVGKTQLSYYVAKWWGAEYIYFQCTYGVDEDSLLYKYIPSEATKSGIKIALGPVPRALLVSQKRKVVLVLDEFDKTRPSADALLLDVLQNYRLSLYLGDNDNETIITGNPDNLIVFLTSNDMREFSEPLLRRLVVVTLNPLPTSVVYEMLKKRFKENIALLLAQVYEDTLKAGLRKPATIQELQQLGQILENGTNVPLQELLRMFIIKYDDDWVKFMQHVSSREPYKFVNDNANSDDITQYYEPPQEVQMPQPQPQSQPQDQTQQLLEKISRITVKQPGTSVVIKEVKDEVNDTIVTSFKALISENDMTNYSGIIKTLEPAPTDVPDVFGKFKIIKDVNEYAITSTQPLSITEYIKLLRNRSVEFEGYIEDELLIFNPDAINYLISNSDEVRYYTNRTVQVLFTDKNNVVTEAIEVVLDGVYDPHAINRINKVRIRAYVKAKKRVSGYGSLLYDFISHNACYVTMKNEINVDAESLAKFARQMFMLRKNDVCDNFDVVVKMPANFNENEIKKIHELLVKDGVNARIAADMEKIMKNRLIKFYYNSYDNELRIGTEW
jgi:hypothetical protein